MVRAEPVEAHDVPFDKRRTHERCLPQNHTLAACDSAEMSAQRALARQLE
jgi:hypothetical protein